MKTIKNVNEFIHSNKFSLSATVIAATFAASCSFGEEVSIASFEEPQSAKKWISDLSPSGKDIYYGVGERTDDATLLFSGELDPSVNGATINFYTTKVPNDLSGMEAVVIEAKGDGTTFYVDLKPLGDTKAKVASHRVIMKTEPGKWKKYVFPLKDFKFRTYNWLSEGSPLDMKKIGYFGFFVTNHSNKNGPFELEIKSIKAVTDVNKVTN